MTENIPDSERFEFTVRWTREMMERARDFEGIVDRMLAKAKQQVMATYCDYREAPGFFPKDREPE